MKLKKSACTNLLFPKSRKSAAEFGIAAKCVADAGFSSMEYYFDGEEKDKIASILAKNGLMGAFIGVIPHKQQLKHLCNTNEEERLDALNFAKSLADEAYNQGCKDIMFNSGKFDENDVAGGLAALENSFEALYNYITQKNYGLRMLMEPCDSKIDAKQLIGPCERTVEFMRRMDAKKIPLRLTIDTAHAAEEGESFLEVLKSVRKWCEQIHYANCVTDDKQSPLYGDKHVSFYQEGSVFTVAQYREITRLVAPLYPADEELRISLEVLCREDDPVKAFSDMAQDVFGGI